MKIAVANTDYNWYSFLRDRSIAREVEGADSREPEEINFWRPSSGQAFRMLKPGEPFLFKLKAPRNMIAGGGFYLDHHKQLPLKLAWDAFGQANGAKSLDTLRSLIAKYRGGDVTDYGTQIGCILLSQPVFFAPEDWVPVPPDWKPNIVSYKGYDTDTTLGRSLWDRVKLLLSAPFSRPDRLSEKTSIPIEEMFGDPRPVRPRRGQGSFRTLVTETYEYRCAVTAGKILPVLEAAHIRPVTSEGLHDIANGILLRSDIHTLFDRGFVTITPDLKFRTSSRLLDEFNNGEEYRRLEGQKVWTPSNQIERPDRELLAWHGDSVFIR